MAHTESGQCRPTLQDTRSSFSSRANNYGTTLPPSVLSGALKIADKVTVAMEAVGEKIRLNPQGWEDARVIGERQGADGRGA